MSLPAINLFEERATEAKKGDRSKLLPSTLAFFRRRQLETRFGLKGDGARHWYVAQSGAVDSPACFQPSKDGVYLVPNGLELVLQKEKISCLLSARVQQEGRERMIFTMAKIDDAGEVEEDPAFSNEDFSAVWKILWPKDRAGNVLNDKKIQQAIYRQLRAAFARDGADGDARYDALPFAQELRTWMKRQEKIELDLQSPSPSSSPKKSATPNSASKTAAAMKRTKKKAQGEVETNVWEVIDKEVVDFEYQYSLLYSKEGAMERLIAEAREASQVRDLDQTSRFIYLTLNLGLMLFSAGKFQEALNELERALESFRGGITIIDDDKLEFIILRWIGRSLQKVGRLDEAEEKLTAVLEHFKNTGSNVHHLAVSYSDLAWIYHDRVLQDPGYATRARGMFEQAIILRLLDDSIENKRILMEDYYGHGCICMLCDDMMEEGLQSFLKSKKLADEVFGDQPPPMAISRVHRGLGLGYAKQENWEHSIFHLQHAITYRISGVGNDHAQVGNLRFLLGFVYQKMGDEVNAARCVTEAKRIWDLNKVPLDSAWRRIPWELGVGNPMQEAECDDLSLQERDYLWDIGDVFGDQVRI